MPNLKEKSIDLLKLPEKTQESAPSNSHVNEQFSEGGVTNSNNNMIVDHRYSQKNSQTNVFNSFASKKIKEIKSENKLNDKISEDQTEFESKKQSGAKMQQLDMNEIEKVNQEQEY